VKLTVPGKCSIFKGDAADKNEKSHLQICETDDGKVIVSGTANSQFLIHSIYTLILTFNEHPKWEITAELKEKREHK